MSAFMKNLATATLLATSVSTVSAQASGSGTTTRFWDCCKPSCAWTGKADVTAPVTTCDIDDSPLDDPDADSGCEEGGTAYMCSDNSPWAVDEDLAYGFAAVSISGGDESSWCCACYELTFTSGPVSGKKMVVQGVNTGADLSTNQFDIAIPGGGVGIFNGCTNQWDAPDGGWGEQYGGISSNTCPSFPEPLSPGCQWRFDWFENADNPTVDFVEVQCPTEITDKSGCTRTDNSTLSALPATPKLFAKTPVKVPGAEVVAPEYTPSSSSWSASSTWATSPLVRRQWPTESISTPSSSIPWPTESVSTPSSSISWPTSGWPWPTGGWGDEHEHEHVRRQDWPWSSPTPSSTPGGGWSWPPQEQNNKVRRQWGSSSFSWPTPTSGWSWPTGGWGQQNEHARRQDWPASSSTGGWSWPTGGWGQQHEHENEHARRQDWPASSSTGGWSWPTGGWGQQHEHENEHARRQDWPPFSWPSSFPTPTGDFPTPTGGWPTPTGGWPTPTGGWPTPTGGWPTPTGGWPWPTGGFPWPPGDGEGSEGDEE